MCDNIYLKQCVRRLKFMIDKTNYAEYIDFLVELKPWMSIKHVLDILSKLINKNNGEKDNGYKAISLLYFVCDLGLEDGIYLRKVVDFIMRNGGSTALCYGFEQIRGNSVTLCGKHVMSNHAINKDSTHFKFCVDSNTIESKIGFHLRQNFGSWPPEHWRSRGKKMTTEDWKARFDEIKVIRDNIISNYDKFKRKTYLK